MKKIKYVKESLNETTSYHRNYINIEVANDILSNKEEFRQEYDKNTYIAIIVIAKAVRNEVPFERAFIDYAESRGWFEKEYQKLYKQKYFNLLEILEELGFDIGDLMDVLNDKDKLMNESLNEEFESENPWVQQFHEEYPDQEDIPSAYDVAEFIDQNWNEITGLSNREKDDEGYFPGEVEEIIDELELDMDDFSQAWASVREGADDEYCDNCGEELTDDNQLDGNGYCDACAPEDDEEYEDED